MNYDKSFDVLRRVTDLIEQHDSDLNFEVFNPATADEIEKTESKGKKEIPLPIQSALKAFQCRLQWDLYEVPDEFEDYDCGTLVWRIDRVFDAEKMRVKDLKKIKSPDDRWRKSFAFLQSPGPGFGLLAVQPDKGMDSPVIRLVDKKRGPGNGAIVGESLESFFHHWMRLGFLAGADAWLAITNEFTRPLDADSKPAKAWLKWLKTNA